MFDPPKIDKTKLTLHTGGALGSDSYFEKVSIEYGISVRAYSYKTKYHNSPNKVEISEEDYLDGISEVNKANKFLNRWGIHKYMNLLARNWAQVKYSKQIISIGRIVDPGQKTSKGYCRSTGQSVDGGTGYAIQMGINNMRDVWVFDQFIGKWFRWSYSSMSFVESECPSIMSNDFAGIGTRDINQSGINAIEDVFKKTFSL
jgi:hypothetical protein